MTLPVKVIEGYVHSAHIGVLVEIALDTSFTAGMPEFKQLAKDLALQVAAVPVATVEDLMDQLFVKDSAVTVAEVIAKTSSHLGERIVVTRFVRWDSEGSSDPAPEPPGAPATAARMPRVA
jgi:elongation factor Ts